MISKKSNPIKQTLLARVYDVASETPLQRADKLSAALDVELYLKREDTQAVHSFKLRGAHNKLVNLTPREKSKGVIAASAGNHAQGVALGAQKLGLSAMIVMPATTPPIKVEAVKSYAAKVELFGDSYSDAYEHARQLEQKTGRVFIHPFDDPLVIAGQGTIGREILEQNSSITHIFVPTGGGGMLAGIAQYVKTLNPKVKVISVEPDDSSAMLQSVKAGKIVELASVGIFADGVAVKKVGKHTFDIARRYVDDFITVNNDQICSAIKAIFEETRTIVEPAGAISLAGALKYKLPRGAIVATICSGANMSFEKLQYIAERTMLGSGHEALFAVHLPEKPGALLRFCNEVINGFSITEFNYRLDERDDANIFVGIGSADSSTKKAFESNLRTHKYIYRDMSDDDVAKEHIRHMIGGKAPKAHSEQFYTIDFPERPGALISFLKKIAGKFNISLFHYRGQGSDLGKVLIGFEADSVADLEKALDKAGHKYTNVTLEPSVRLFT